MQVDSVSITVKAGKGGNGAVTFLRNSQTAKGGPNGGNGGNGGSVFFRGSTHVNDLAPFRYRKSIQAENGTDGKAKNMFGANAPDTVIDLPVGTQIRDMNTGKMYTIDDTVTLIKIARGGRGGRGNKEFATPTNRTPTYAEPGKPGEERELLLDLRLIAGIGLIGLPNAGKSSLLSVLTNAKPAIGNYPFTTLSPNIGMMGKYAVADIPGLIGGASTGKGLGFRFLKHIEKTKILVHCIESTADDPLGAYETVRREFAEYNEQILHKPEIILLTKTDLVDSGRIDEYTKLLKSKNPRVYSCSVYDGKSIDKLRSILIPLAA